MATNFTSGTVSAGDDATADQYNDLRTDVLQNAGDYETSGGSSNAYTLAIDSSITAYAEGQVFKFKSNFANTGASTLNVNSIGAKTLKKSNGVALQGSEIQSGQIVVCVYDGTDMLVVSELADSGSVSKHTYGESITAPAGVFIEPSDGKVYKTDGATAAEISNYIGIAIDDGVADDVGRVSTSGSVSDFSGLTTGTKYYLANAGTSDATQTVGNVSSSSSTHDIGKATDNRISYAFTVSAVRSIFTGFDVIISQKQGSPTGNVIASLYMGSASGADNVGVGSGMFIESVSVAVSSFSAGGVVTFNFTDQVLKAGTYYIVLSHDTLDNSNYMICYSSTTTTAVTTWNSDTDTWATNGTNTTRNFYFTSETFAEGDITTYFYTYKKIVGIAKSSTELELIDQPSIQPPFSRSAGTTYQASYDGFLTVYVTGGSVTLVVDNTTVMRSASGGSAGSGAIVNFTYPILKGDYYKFTVVSGSLGVANFFPIYR